MCIKRRLTITAAQKIISEAQNSPNPNRQEKKFYYCNECKAYHTTKKAGKNWDFAPMKPEDVEAVTKENERVERLYLEADNYREKNKKLFKKPQKRRK